MIPNLAHHKFREPLRFFEEFKELSERTTFLKSDLGDPHVELRNPVCGDVVKVRMELEQDTVVFFGYQQQGCWPVIGCLELLGRLLQGARLADLHGFTVERFLTLVQGVPASKRHAFSLTHRATLQALSQAAGRSISI